MAVSGSKSLGSNFFLANLFYIVERINNFVTQKALSRPVIATIDTDSTVLDEDVSGYSSFSTVLSNPGANGVTFSIQGNHKTRPGFYALIGSTINVAAGATSVSTFTGEFDRIRVLAKNQTPGQASKAWSSLKARIGG